MSRQHPFGACERRHNASTSPLIDHEPPERIAHCSAKITDVRVGAGAVDPLLIYLNALDQVVEPGFSDASQTFATVSKATMLTLDWNVARLEGCSRNALDDLLSLQRGHSATRLDKLPNQSVNWMRASRRSRVQTPCLHSPASWQGAAG